jgi:hypothetical protein
VYARHRAAPDSAPFYLEDGQADQQREFTRAHLECFMPECGDRRLTTVNRGHRARDGFMHVAGGAGGHTKESLFQGKALIRRWVHSAYPTMQVQEEARAGEVSGSRMCS